jgi:hypothetical protein
MTKHTFILLPKLNFPRTFVPLTCSVLIRLELLHPPTFSLRWVLSVPLQSYKNVLTPLDPKERPSLTIIVLYKAKTYLTHAESNVTLEYS